MMLLKKWVKKETCMKTSGLFIRSNLAMVWLSLLLCRNFRRMGVFWSSKQNLSHLSWTGKWQPFHFGSCKISCQTRKCSSYFTYGSCKTSCQTRKCSSLLLDLLKRELCATCFKMPYTLLLALLHPSSTKLIYGLSNAYSACKGSQY